MKIYIVKLESMVDGEVFFEAIPCASEEVARQVLEKEKNTILHESFHFSFDGETYDHMEIEEGKDSFYINDPYDDYYENYTIEEKELIEKP